MYGYALLYAYIHLPDLHYRRRVYLLYNEIIKYYIFMSFVEFFALNLYRTDRDVVFCGRGDNGGRASQQHNHTYIYIIL